MGIARNLADTLAYQVVANSNAHTGYTVCPTIGTNNTCYMGLATAEPTYTVSSDGLHEYLDSHELDKYAGKTPAEAPTRPFTSYARTFIGQILSNGTGGYILDSHNLMRPSSNKGRIATNAEGWTPAIQPGEVTNLEQTIFFEVCDEEGQKSWDPVTHFLLCNSKVSQWDSTNNHSPDVMWWGKLTGSGGAQSIVVHYNEAAVFKPRNFTIKLTSTEVQG